MENIELNKLRGLTRKIGFWQVIELLSKYSKPIPYKEFNEEYSLMSCYYNSYRRIRDELTFLKIIELTKTNGKREIILTEKGIALYEQLKKLNELIFTTEERELNDF